VIELRNALVGKADGVATPEGNIKYAVMVGIFNFPGVVEHGMQRKQKGERRIPMCPHKDRVLVNKPQQQEH
jgi:hypothetical protein